MSKFTKDFQVLNYVIKESEKVLLFAHSRPDGDTLGAVLSLNEYLKSIGKKTTVACFDPFPEFLKTFSQEKIFFPAEIDLRDHQVVIACDSVERGFEKILPSLGENQVIALLDHHPDIKIRGDINVIDPEFSSACEIVYHFFKTNSIEIRRETATFLMLGILSDTGGFQHSNTTARIMEISSELVKKGARISKISEAVFSNKKTSTLKLWSKAFERAKINRKNGLISSIITQKDLLDCQASPEDISYVAGILNTVPGTRFSLILSEREGGLIKGSLRSEEYKGVDVSQIATSLGGGGHKLASGFEMKGKIVETAEGWKVV